MAKTAIPDGLNLQRLRDIGWRYWDPIGLLPKGERWDQPQYSAFADEYDRYLVSAAMELRANLPRDEVVEFLIETEAERMGLGYRGDHKERAEAVVEAILNDADLWF